MIQPDFGRAFNGGLRRSVAEAAVSDGLEIFPIAIGIYDHHPNLDVETAVQQIVLALSEFGSREVGWSASMADRGADAVDARLREWARPAVTADSILYWVGHGWSDGTDVALAHARSPFAVRTSGVLPTQIAEPVRGRQITADGRWTMVVIDACWSARFVDKVNAQLAEGPVGADAVLLVGVSGDGAASLGRFRTVLQACLQENFRADRTIALWQLAQELDRRLPQGLVAARRLAGAALERRTIPIAGTISVSLDVLRELEEALARLSDDERRHFLVKAQGADEGEVSWFFEGRADERRRIVEWLRTTNHGLLIVTGLAGSGKSALLGHVLMHSLPDLREALVRAGLVDRVPTGELPPEGVFDHVIHLTGISLRRLIQRIAIAVGFGEPPSHADLAAGYGTATDLDWLVYRLQRRSARLTLMLDALDEAIDPLALALTVLRRIATVPGVRVLVGTRTSTSESPDHSSPGDENLLQALGAASGNGNGVSRTSGSVEVVRLAHDRDAVTRYVTRRLSVARDRGNLMIGGKPVSDSVIRAAATAVGSRRREFLFARLAVYEVLADPSLLSPARSVTFHRLLAADHRELFGAAITRLGRHSDSFLPLLEALALARGRGVPILDGIWALMATALAADSAGGLTITDADISALLAAAQPYIVVDASAGQTVYRLAHRTFVEHFAAQRRVLQPGDKPSRLIRKQRRISAALLAAAEGSLPTARNPYLVRNLSGHVADANLWPALAASPTALDRLDPYMVTTDALRTVVGWVGVPPPIAGVIGARQHLARAEPADRPGLRQLATSKYSRQEVNQEPTTSGAPWGVVSAAVGHLVLHVLLAGHQGDVNGLCTVRGLQGRQLLASAGDDGAIRLWNPATANPVGTPLLGHAGPVQGVCPVSGPADRALLASAGSDGTVRLWDPATASAFGAPLTGHTGTVWEVCSVPGPTGQALLASAGADGTVRLWDPATASAFGAPLTGHTGTVWEVCSVPGPAGQALLASAGTDGTVRLWDPATSEPACAPLIGHIGPVMGLCTVEGPAGRVLLASAGADGTVRLWDPVTALAFGAPLTGHTGPVWGVCSVPGLGKQALLASAGVDGTVRFWDPAAASAFGGPLTGHTGPVWKVCSVPGPSRQALLASAGVDGTVRLWDPATAMTLDMSLTGHTGTIWKVCSLSGPVGRALLASAGNDGVVRLWDPATATPTGNPLSGHTGAVAAVCPVPLDDRALLASAGTDGTVRLWDAVTSTLAAGPLPAHSGTVTAICPLGARGGQLLLASAGDDGTVRLWDPATASPLGCPMTGHIGTIRELCEVPTADGQLLLASAGDDGSIRLWDPATSSAVGPPMTGHVGPVEGVCAVPVGGKRVLLASAGDDGTVRLWDPATASPLGAPLTGHSGAVRGVCAVPVNGEWALLASVGDDGTVRLWDPATASPLGAPLTGHSGAVRGVCAVPVDGERALLASVGDDETIRLWDPETGTAVGAALSGNPAAVDAIAEYPSPGDRPLQAITGQTGSLRIWDPMTARLDDQITGHHGAITAISTFTGRDGDVVVVTGGADGTLRSLQPRSTAVSRAPIEPGVGQVLALCTLPGEPGLVAVAGSDGTLTAWDLVAGRRVREPIPGGPGCIRSLYVPGWPDQADLLLSGGQDGTIRRWDIASWQPVGRPWLAHAGWVWSIFAIDVPGCQRPQLVSVGADGAVRMWDTTTLDPVGVTLTGHTDQVRAACQVRLMDGRVLLATGGHDQTIRLWNPVDQTLRYTIPLGISVHALSQHPLTAKLGPQAGEGAILIVGTRDGVLAVSLSESLFPS